MTFSTTANTADLYLPSCEDEWCVSSADVDVTMMDMDMDVVVTDEEELSATSHQEASKVLEEWQSDHGDHESIVSSSHNNLQFKIVLGAVDNSALPLRSPARPG